jgi:hypothetical protein
VFYSPWIFPIYKFDPKIGNLRLYNEQGYHTLIVIFGVWLWSIMLVIWVSPTSVGICLGCLIEVAASVWFVFLTTYSTDELGAALERDDLFQECIKRAWLDARIKFLQSKNALKIADVVTFEEHKKERANILNFIQAQRKTYGKSGKVGPIQGDANKKESRDLHELYEQLLLVDANILLSFKDEVRLLIHLELLLMTSINHIIVMLKNFNNSFSMRKNSE